LREEKGVSPPWGGVFFKKGDKKNFCGGEFFLKEKVNPILKVFNWIKGDFWGFKFPLTLTPLKGSTP